MTLLPLLFLLRIGIVGTDTSHVTAFTKQINEMPDAKVVAAYKGGSQEIESSRNRVEGLDRKSTRLNSSHW